MANRDHSLDGRIHDAAFSEFTEKGYADASLRNIAERAGVTVGAIRTRYAAKDDLFAACVSPLTDDIADTFGRLKDSYMSIGADGDAVERLYRTIATEAEEVVRILFDHYDEAVLLICRSGGSSLEGVFDSLVEKKTEESIRFFETRGMRADGDMLALVISSQYDSYRCIIRSGCGRDEAVRRIKEMAAYHAAGYRAIAGSLCDAEGE